MAKDERPLAEQLDSGRSDHVALALRGALGAVPLAGSLLAELAGNVIPNQRIDRLVAYARELDQRLERIEKDSLARALENAEFADLLEESARQATHALTPDRKAYLAELVARSLSSEELAASESRHLIRILGELSDVEVIWLRSYLMPVQADDKGFRSKHKDILRSIPVTLGSSQEEKDAAALQGSYKQHLAQLGLLEAEFRVDDGVITARGNPRPPKVAGYNITSLGRLLLRQIGLGQDVA